MMMDVVLNDAEFETIREYVYKTSGIIIGAEKHSMIISRLWRHLESLGHADFASYLAFLRTDKGKVARDRMLDLLTTNETYFFREPAHFHLLRNEILPSLVNRVPRIWCAAASTGEEPYSIAMLMADVMGLRDWQLLATDISKRALEKAVRGIYRMERLELMPPTYLQRFCRRGVGEYEGSMIVDQRIRSRVTFANHNLLQQPRLDTDGSDTAGQRDQHFDVIFLRNVLIYFDQSTKQRVIENLASVLRPGGWLITGHCESLSGIATNLRSISPSVHRFHQQAQNAFRRLPA